MLLSKIDRSAEYNTKQVADILGIAPSSVRRLMKTKQLTYTKAPGVIISGESLYQYVEKRTHVAEV